MASHTEHAETPPTGPGEDMYHSPGAEAPAEPVSENHTTRRSVVLDDTSGAQASTEGRELQDGIEPVPDLPRGFDCE